MRYSLALPEHLVQEAKVLTGNSDISLDQFFIRAIFKRIYELKAHKLLEDNIEHSSVEDALDILDQLLNVE
ncbi:hypothetical protein H0A36_10890 [Endozoicomonas sp. SM1973]|uniref:Uncharacterized protein n=1 Tax=Spartinivicinus marinus TaxID=2994442 RepID=A0A853IAD7_9GAMM|nr:hypothetical protein [Spartinivicinus marinus]MCX4024840.1 hypothetical protein [Spartinivicinus marinus]NYZ66517.1 hypothetical protein [Spartinivicinus marinus]